MMYLTPNRLNRELNQFWKSHNASQSMDACEKNLAAYGGPSIDIQETSDAFLVRAEMPGMEKEDFTVKFEDDHLIIHGEKKKTHETKNGNRHWMECSYGSFKRVVHFPSSVNSNQVQADYKNGVLDIRLPKTEAAKIKEIPIQFN